MKKLLVLLMVVVLAGAGVVTCPQKQAHVNAIMEAVEGAAQEKAAETGLGGQLLMGLGKQFLGGLVATALEKNLEYHNYFVCSTCTFEKDGEQKMVSLGVFGHIFTMDKDDVLSGFGK